MKKLFLILAVAMLAACTPKTEIADGDFAIPSELTDCKFYKMRDDGGNRYTVIRCPNSTTSTTSHGKYKKRTVVIDGVEYQETSK